jgi:hypothetical protein
MTKSQLNLARVASITKRQPSLVHLAKSQPNLTYIPMLGNPGYLTQVKWFRLKTNVKLLTQET